jgi:hypothetical protein
LFEKGIQHVGEASVVADINNSTSPLFLCELVVVSQTFRLMQNISISKTKQRGKQLKRRIFFIG